MTTANFNLKNAHITNSQYFLIRMLSALSFSEERDYGGDH